MRINRRKKMKMLLWIYKLLRNLKINRIKRPKLKRWNKRIRNLCLKLKSRRKGKITTMIIKPIRYKNHLRMLTEMQWNRKMSMVIQLPMGRLNRKFKRKKKSKLKLNNPNKRKNRKVKIKSLRVTMTMKKRSNLKQNLHPRMMTPQSKMKRNKNKKNKTMRENT